MSFTGFSPEFFAFFRELSANNDRGWFQANKARYKAEVEAPLLDFISAMAEPLGAISPHIAAIPKVQGGSMFRIHRDVRFAKDKSPFKTHAAAQFRHTAGSDAHAPGYYLHLAPGEVFFGGGVYRPPAAPLKQIREAISAKPERFRAITGDARFIEVCGGLGAGDPLARAPKGFAPDDPMIEDVKKRSFFVTADSDEARAGRADFVDEVAERYRVAAPFMGFLCDAMGVAF